MLDQTHTGSPFLTNDADIDLAMGHFAESGLKILRTWGFNDVNTVPGEGWFTSSSTNDVSASTPERTAFSVWIMSFWQQRRRESRLIIPFVNNWDDYGA